ncbi:type 1 fimbrial protein [Xenorhabdus nematophila]|uniref:Fimbrial adaptor, MrxG n=2 Tax=Xenorhabdus nematophila TaxID=628 RepID=D3VB55_XENNA|nr:fimbrial protein [Xenorhabdus nematophila]CEE90582.1 Fimbrial adaptor, MrxG [Xenorhabdus nematophila str. Anatoliense]CEF28759.1 Fimbrial adaptor, MrxG [Xenorhabdus nematophila str. Websteri]AAM91934.1 putative fimbrial adaptor [Xenorhabdus nematophila]AYA42314.1 type 1 fimbrial protein [Xenorhabdus nematophila]KHD29216.1 pilus assembly protein [Xenorhabdus nematophila]
MNLLSIKLSKYVLPALFLFGIGSQQIAHANINAKDILLRDVRIKLTVLAPACSIKTEDKNIEVDFGNISNKDLYQHHRTESRNFNLRLEKCDPRVTKSLKIKFSGETSKELPGLLAVKSTARTVGVAIGMEKTDGTPIPFNKTSEFPLLASRDNVIPFRAYVQAEPGALKGKKIGVGQFTAIATFEVNYD